MASSSEDEYNSEEDIIDLEVLWTKRPFLPDDDESQAGDGGEKQIVLELEPLTSDGQKKTDPIKKLMNEIEKISTEISSEVHNITALQNYQNRLQSYRQQILNLGSPVIKDNTSLMNSRPLWKPTKRQHLTPIATAQPPIARARPEPSELSLPRDQHLSYRITQRLRETFSRNANSQTSYANIGDGRQHSHSDFSLPEEHRLSYRISQHLRDTNNRGTSTLRRTTNPIINTVSEINYTDATNSANNANSAIVINLFNATPGTSKATNDINSLLADIEEPEELPAKDPRFILPRAIREREIEMEKAAMRARAKKH